MPAPIYECSTAGGTGGAVTVTTTAKTVLGVKSHANSGLLLLGFRLGFDGTSGAPIFVELGTCSWGANAPGTASSTVTPVQRSGRSITAGFTAAKNWTTEPTTITVVNDFFLTPNGGLFVYDYPLGTELDAGLNTDGFVIRCTVPSAGSNVNLRGSMLVSRC